MMSILMELPTNFSFGHAAEVEELSATNMSAAFNRYALDKWRIEREDTLDTNTVGDFPNTERLVWTCTATCDDDTGEILRTLFVTFDDAERYGDGIARLEVRDCRIPT